MPLQHVEIPVPIPKKDEILIKTQAVAINPVDFKVQNGAFRPLYPKSFPCIPCKYKRFCTLYSFPRKFVTINI